MLCHSLRCSTLPSNQISNPKYATDEPWQEKDIGRGTRIVEAERGEELMTRWRRWRNEDGVDNLMLMVMMMDRRVVMMRWKN